MYNRLELLVSSRHKVNVYNKFPNTIIINLRRSVSDTETDITIYITTEVKGREKDERILRGDYLYLEKRLITILNKRASGIYDKSLDYY